MPFKSAERMSLNELPPRFESALLAFPCSRLPQEMPRLRIELTDVEGLKPFWVTLNLFNLWMWEELLPSPCHWDLGEWFTHGLHHHSKYHFNSTTSLLCLFPGQTGRGHHVIFEACPDGMSQFGWIWHIQHLGVQIWMHICYYMIIYDHICQSRTA